MKRKLLSLLVLLVISAMTIGAFDITDDWTLTGTIDQHPEILIGFIPTYGELTVGYKGLELMPGDRTEFQLSAGGGYVERRFWINKEGNEDKTMTQPLTFDALQITWALRFNQGFLESPVGGKDFITLSLGYEGRYEKAFNAIADEKKSWGSLHAVQTIDEFFSAGMPDRLFEDIRGARHDYLGTNFNFQFKLDSMVDTLTTNDGYLVTFDIDWSPLALNSGLSGKADYYQFTLQGVGAKTLYEYKTEKMSWFSIVLANRLRVNWLSGEYVPTYVQKLGSLGRQVRGYSNYTYGTEFYIVNNFDIRLTGPDMGLDGLALRINLFFDMGYGCGNYFNTTRYGSNFLASTGAQFTISILDFIDLGYQVAYLIGDGRNFAAGDTHLSMSATFFLDF